jgi:hypothetical protein
MTISDRNRKLFEGVGLETVRRELATRVYYYLSSGSAESLEQAREWVAEQEKVIEDAEAAKLDRDDKLLRYSFWTLLAAIIAAIAAVASIIILPR